MPKHSPPRRLIDVAVIAPIIGFVLMIPPVIGLFANAGEIFGAPVILIYLFSVWLGFIFVAAALSRRLGAAHKSDSE